MHVEFKTKCGFKAKCVSAHMALIDWFINLHPEKDIWYFSADEPSFILQIESAIERQFNHQPSLDKSLSHESQCKRLLLVLHEHGDISILNFA